MAAKGKDMVAAAPDFESPEYDSLFETDPDFRLGERIQAATACSTSDMLDQNAKQQVVEQAVEATLASALVTIDLLYPARDGEAVTTTSLINGSWDAEPEPDPCAMDNWLRATIPESQLPKQSYMLSEFLRGAAAASGRAGELRRMDSKSTRGRPSVSGAGTPPPDKKAPTVAPSRSPQNSPPTNARRKNLTPDQAAAEQRLREELDIRRAQLAVLADMEAKDKEARARVANLSKELKGKEYVYDHKGQVVPVAAVPGADAVGSQGAGTTRFAVCAHDEGAAGKAGRKGAASGGSKKGGNAGPGPAGQRKLINDFKESQARGQPSPLQTLTPSSGVTLRGGGASKSGPARAARSGLGMTREELDRYAASVAHASAAASSTRSTVATAATAITTATTATTATAGPDTPAQPAVTTASHNGPTDGRTRLEPLQPRQSATATTVATVATQPSETALSTTSGKRSNRDGLSSTASAFQFGEGMLAHVPDSPSRLAGATMRLPPPDAAAAAAARKPVTPDANPALVGASDWGRSTGATTGRQPALESTKPSSRLIEKEVGRLDRLPRDRVSQATGSPPLSPAKLQPHIPQPTFVLGR